MSTYSQLYGSGGTAIGSYVAGNLSGDADYLPADGSIYNKLDYPNLDTSSMLTIGSNTVSTGPTIGTGITSIERGGSMLIAYSASATYYTSTDDGVTWTSRTFPGAASLFSYVNGVWFGFLSTSSTTIYTSSDGINWTSRTTGGSYIYSCVGYVNGQYVIGVVVGTTQFSTLRSTDLTTWTLTNLITGGTSVSLKTRTGSLKASSSYGLVFHAFSDSLDRVFCTTNGIQYDEIVNAVEYDLTTSLLGTNSYVDNTDCFSTSTAFGKHISYLPKSQTKGNGAWLQLKNNIFIKGVVGGVYISEVFGGVTSLICTGSANNIKAAIVTDTKILWVNNTTGVVQYVNLDLTKFRALYPRASFDGPHGALFIKAR